MAQIWTRHGDEPDWAILPLEHAAIFAGSLDGSASDAPASIAFARSRGTLGAPVDLALHRHGDGLTERWLLIAAPAAQVRVNGDAPLAGARVLNDKDEISLAGGRRLFFSTERRAEIQLYAGDDEPRCARCRQPVADQTPTVRCTGCGVLYHQTDDLPCFTFREVCQTCRRETSLDAGFAWTPEGL